MLTTALRQTNTYTHTLIILNNHNNNQMLNSNKNVIASWWQSSYYISFTQVSIIIIWNWELFQFWKLNHMFAPFINKIHNYKRAPTPCWCCSSRPLPLQFLQPLQHFLLSLPHPQDLHSEEGAEQWRCLATTRTVTLTIARASSQSMLQTLDVSRVSHWRWTLETDLHWPTCSDQMILAEQTHSLMRDSTVYTELDETVCKQSHKAINYYWGPTLWWSFEKWR